MYTKHVCTLDCGSESNLPQISQSFPRFCRFFRKFTIVSHKNKQCHEYFRSNAAILLERKRHVQSNLLYIIHPFSIFRLYWEALMTVIFLLALILNPLDNMFQMSSYGWTLITVCIFSIDIMCILDIIISFVTGYGKKVTKDVVLDPIKIVKKHLKNPYFYFETLACVPMIFWSINEEYVKSECLRIIGLLKIFRMRKFFIYLMRASDVWQLSALGCTIMEYSILAILLLHWTGCIHYTLPCIAVISYGKSIDDYWIGKYLLNDFSWIGQYSRCVFRAALLLLNISSGVFEPTSNLDIVLCILTFIVGNIYVAVMLVLILQMMSSSLSAESKYQEIINQVYEYMRCKQLPINMQKRLITYYEYRFQKKYFREDLISASLSVRLRREINVYCYRRLIESVSIFKDMPQHLMVDVVNSLKEEIFLPNDIIVKANSVGDCMYFIASGTVCVTTPTGKEICHLYDGAYFGEVALLMKDQKRIANVYALEICEIYRLDRKKFRNCFLINTELYKKLEKTAYVRIEKTAILEELHKKYLLSLETNVM